MEQIFMKYIFLALTVLMVSPTYAAGPVGESYLPPQFRPGETSASVFSISRSVRADGFDELVRRHADRGVLVGLGGAAAEALKDVSRRVAPISSADAEEMLDELRGRALLDGWRGNPALSRSSVIQAMLALSAIIVTCGSVGEIEINPFRVYPDRGLVLDALIVRTIDCDAVDL
jgi:ATP-grasp domain